MNYRYCPQHFCCLLACCTYTVYCKFTFIECNDCNVYLNYMYLHPVRLRVQLQSFALLVQHYSQLNSRTSSRYSSKHTCHGPGICDDFPHSPPHPIASIHLPIDFHISIPMLEICHMLVMILSPLSCMMCPMLHSIFHYYVPIFHTPIIIIFILNSIIHHL